jgi:adenylate kinase family enzyme
MNVANGTGVVGRFQVFTTSNRGHTPEELADMALERLISVSDTAPEQIRMQAEVYKAQLHNLLVHYMKKAVEQDRLTVCRQLEDSGQVDIANIIRSL